MPKVRPQGMLGRVGAYLDDCLKRRVIFFTGKGGVGKSSLAWATALACRRKNRRVTLANWSPFDAATQPLGEERENVDWMPLDTLGCFREYALQFMKFEKFYDTVFDNHVLRTFLKAAPGLSETVISGKLWSVFDSGEQDLLIVDMPASGHAVSFFQSPLGVKNMFSMGFVHKEAGRICDMFSHEGVRLDIVALPEEMSMVESRQLHDKLASIHPFNFGYLHVNQCTPEFPLPAPGAVGSLPPDEKLIVDRYVQRRQLETEAIALTSEIRMAKIPLPAIPRETGAETIRVLAEKLAVA